MGKKTNPADLIIERKKILIFFFRVDDGHVVPVIDEELEHGLFSFKLKNRLCLFIIMFQNMLLEFPIDRK